MDRLRIDRWLWCARFFKTRTLAAEEVKAGHVRLNGQRTKPAHELRVGDALSIARGHDDIGVVVARIPERRGPASEAAGCYEETPESIERRRLRALQRRSVPVLDAPTANRPDKRTRRLIRSRQRYSTESEESS
jgi:ribosome-associated heat shock protein Hsp15